MSTRSPGVRPETPVPDRAPRRPRRRPRESCGSGTPGIPLRTKMSRRLSAAARISDDAPRPARATGSGQVAVLEDVVAAVLRKKTAFIGSGHDSRSQLLQIPSDFNFSRYSRSLSRRGGRRGSDRGRRRSRPCRLEGPRPKSEATGRPGRSRGHRDAGPREERRRDVLRPDAHGSRGRRRRRRPSVRGPPAAGWLSAAITTSDDLAPRGARGPGIRQTGRSPSTAPRTGPGSSREDVERRQVDGGHRADRARSLGEERRARPGRRPRRRAPGRGRLRFSIDGGPGPGSRRPTIRRRKPGARPTPRPPRRRGRAARTPRRERARRGRGGPEPAQVPGRPERRPQRGRALRPHPLERANAMAARERPWRGPSRSPAATSVRAGHHPVRRARGGSRMAGCLPGTVEVEPVDGARRRAGSIAAEGRGARRDRELAPREEQRIAAIETRDAAAAAKNAAIAPRRAATRSARTLARGRPAARRSRSSSAAMATGTPPQERLRPGAPAPGRRSRRSRARGRAGRRGAGDRRGEPGRRAPARGREGQPEAGQRRRQQVGHESMDEERANARGDRRIAGFRDVEGRHGGQRGRGRADQDGGEKGAAPAFEHGPEQKSFDARVEVAELPKPRARLLERRRGAGGLTSRRSRTTRARSARTAARAPRGVRAAATASSSSPTSVASRTRDRAPWRSWRGARRAPRPSPAAPGPLRGRAGRR